ncbi:MAG: hypothetical protein ACUVX9_16805 [Anaerolineae bacterium]
MSRQHGNPYIVRAGEVQQLQPAQNAFDEAWLQGFLLAHPEAIPVGEIEPAFAPLIPVCRELPTAAGPIDLLFANHAGLLTLVECKLWKNPAARRQVVGQILDYAKELSRWSFEDLQAAIRAARGTTEPSLYQLVAASSEDLDERDFVDSASRNLRRGRFLLLIVGDGIRENVERIAAYMHGHAHLNFGLALVECGIYRLPAGEDDGYLVQPRVVAQTVEIERAVFRIEEGRIAASELPASDTATSEHRRTKISEQEFYEKVEIDGPTRERLRNLLGRMQEIGVYVEPGHNSLKLKLALTGDNIGVFTVKGEFYNCGIAATTADRGRPDIGEAYLTELAALFPQGRVERGPSRFWWTVKGSPGNRYLRTLELLAVEDRWLQVVRATLDRLAESDGG